MLTQKTIQNSHVAPAYRASARTQWSNTMINRFPTNKASSEPTRRTCLKGAAGFALAALGGLNQVAQAATATTPGTTVSGETVAASSAGEPGTIFAYVGCRTTKERNARGEGSTSTG